ncbi:MAG: DNA repair protein RecN [Cyclobacteriaceae bacterium]|nr:DNA repair protein RecN [Cyclobacteriaceae bacterium]
MLTHLTIQNYALIQSLEMSPSSRLNIITGETGAGKSIMLGAIGLLLGKRADTKVLLNEGQKCIIEGLFNIEAYDLDTFFKEQELDYENETSIRREITPTGKSRAFVNDTPVNLDTLKKLGSYLMDVHSQNETLLLGAADFQLDIIDAFSGSQPLVKEYQRLYTDFKEKEAAYNQLLNDGEELKKEADYNAFLLNELVDLNLKEEEQEPLEDELKVLENAEEIKQRLNEALQSLNDTEFGALERLLSVKLLLNQLTNYGAQFEKSAHQFEQAFIELKELTRDLENEQEGISVDFGRTEEVQQRLSAIYQLQKKHQVSTIKELLDTQQSLEEKTFAANNLDEAKEKTKSVLDKAALKAESVAQELSKKRLESLPSFTNSIKVLLAPLGIPNASIMVNAEIKTFGVRGINDLNILFSANKGVAPQSLKQVASGGEFSRLMFCIKYLLADKTALPTIVFDEIDTGISGEIALKMGAMMQKMANTHQVIAISHLPQIAAKGNTHYFVYKDNSSTRAISSIKKLSNDESIEAIAKMIGGDSASENAYESARELMQS